MQIPTRARGLARVAGELVLIVVGVAIALMADDLRQQREVAESTDAAVRFLISDLERDSARLAGLLNVRPGSNPALGLLLMNTDRSSFPTDSAEAALHELLLAPFYEPARAAFDQLVQQDALRYIGDFNLQADVIRYFDEVQDAVILWDGFHLGRYQAWSAAYGRYVSPKAASVEQAMSDWSAIEGRLTVSWDALRRDNVFMHSIYERQVVGQLYERRLRRALEQNSDLRARLTALAGDNR